MFEDVVMAAFQDALVDGLAVGDVRDLELAGRRTIAATGEAGGVVVFREGDALVAVSSNVDADAVLIDTRLLEAWPRGERGTGELRAPLVATPPGAVFVPVPPGALQAFAPPGGGPPQAGSPY